MTKNKIFIRLLTKEGECKMLNIKNFKGITLISLIATIIVLLILAGVSIAMLIGENRNTCTSKEGKGRN